MHCANELVFTVLIVSIYLSMIDIINTCIMYRFYTYYKYIIIIIFFILIKVTKVI